VTGRPGWTGPFQAFGLLTVVPVPARAATSARGVLPWAPLVGLALGGVAAGIGVLGARTVSPLVGAVLALTALALLTRGLHLDGLADTADGLGSGKPAEDALRIMKQSDIGPFGVITLVLVLLAQASALGTIAARWDDHRVILAAVLACAAGRATLPWACRRGVPAARAEGLGAMVANTVPWPAAVGVAAAGIVGVTVGGWLLDFGFGRSLLAALLAAAAADLLLRRCRGRFGGITGDVLGALVETATTVTLVVLSTT